MIEIIGTLYEMEGVAKVNVTKENFVKFGKDSTKTMTKCSSLSTYCKVMSETKDTNCLTGGCSGARPEDI